MQAVDWSTVPRLVHPMGGCLPEKRLVKKCQQLESMAAEVVKIAAGKSCFCHPKDTLISASGAATLYLRLCRAGL